MSAAAVHASRVDAARRGIERALQRRVATYRRELERQVCEVGFDYRTTPPHRRPEPHQFSEAIQAMVVAGDIGEREVKIRNQPYRFWHRSGVNQATVDAVLARKVAALDVVLRAEAIPRYSGHHAEGIHHEAMLRSGAWLSRGWQAGHQIRSLGAHVLAAGRAADVDLAGHHRATGIPFVVQIKNAREWFYPPDDALWNLFGAAAQLHAFPIFIGRRLPERVFVLMKLVGGFAFRAVKMIFPPEIEHWTPDGGTGLTLTQALQVLGFLSDVDFITEPLPRHESLWTGALAGEIEDAFQRFSAVRERVLEVAYEEGLAVGVHYGRRSRRPRREIFEEFYGEMRQRYVASLREQIKAPPDEPVEPPL